MTKSGENSEVGKIEFQRLNPAAHLLQAEHCALLVIDIQEKLLPPIYNHERMVQNCQLLLRLAQILPLPVLASTQYARGLGNFVPEIASLLGDVDVVDKLSFSCLGSEDYCARLEGLQKQRKTLLICGMETHICVMQSAVQALARGYKVHVAADAVSSRTRENREIGLRRMRAAGCVISSTEMMIYELLRRSGTAEFKEILKYLK